jgi:hypothetical protein
MGSHERILCVGDNRGYEKINRKLPQMRISVSIGKTTILLSGGIECGLWIAECGVGIEEAWSIGHRA